MAGYQNFALEIPPEAAYLATARLFTAEVARHFQCPEHSVEDLKLAISEVCSHLLSEGEEAGIRVEIGANGNRLDFKVESRSKSENTFSPIPSSVPPGNGGPGLDIVTALFQDAVLRTDQSGAKVLTFSLRL